MFVKNALVFVDFLLLFISESYMNEFAGIKGSIEAPGAKKPWWKFW